jgi:hypothetical protein
VLAYQTVYHPSATRLADATRVPIGAGEERTGIDVQARLTNTFSVSGHVRDHTGQPISVGMTLIPGDARDLSTDGGFETATAISSADGRFTFFGVPPGQYTIRLLRLPRMASTAAPAVTSIMTTAGGGTITYSSGIGAEAPPPAVPVDPTLWAEVPVTVAGHVDNVALNIRTGARVRGTVVFDGSAPPLEPRQRQSMSFTLVPATGRTAGRQPPPGRLVDENSFLTAQYPPGRYFINVSGPPAPWLVRSVIVGGRNAMDEPVDLGATDIDGVSVTFTTRTTQVDGTVRSASSTVPFATVVMFPDDHARWIANGMRATRTRTVATGQDGSFHLTGLQPGAYRLVALAPGVSVDLFDAATIEGLSRQGSSITLVEGDARSVGLTVSSIR